MDGWGGGGHHAVKPWQACGWLRVNICVCVCVWGGLLRLGVVVKGMKGGRAPCRCAGAGVALVRLLVVAC
jgi:hypothetical protein